MSGRQRPVAVGQRFGRGIVLVPDAGRDDKCRAVLVKLMCDCGTEYEAIRSSLWNGGIQSCGCLGQENRVTNGKANRKESTANVIALHDRIERERGKAKDQANPCLWGCTHDDYDWYDWAHNLGEIGSEYEYVAMCRLCHKRFDKAIRAMLPEYDERDTWQPWAVYAWRLWANRMAKRRARKAQ